jgi:hypothetical protein
MQPITQASLDPNMKDIKHLRADQEFCGVIGCLGLVTLKTPGTNRLLGGEPAFPWVACRCFLTRGKRPRYRWLNRAWNLLTRCQSSVEQQRSRRSWWTFRVASADRSRSKSDGAVFGHQVNALGSSLSVVLWFGVRGDRLVSAYWGSRSPLQ